MLTVEIKTEGVQAALVAVGRTLSNTLPLMKVLQRRGVNEVKAHFLRRNGEGNRHGWPSKNFWSREGRDHTGAGAVSTDSAAIVIASPAIAQKVYGGPITPKRGKMLAIPLTAEAYATGSPRNWEAKGGRFLFRPAGRRFLAVRAEGGGKGRLMALWALVPSVTQAKDLRALPQPGALQAAMQAEADAWVARQLQKAVG